jgi:hypothetical protein
VDVECVLILWWSKRYFSCTLLKQSWVCSVGIASGYMLDKRGRSSSPGGGKNFHFSMLFRQALRPTKPPIQWIPGTSCQG